MNQTAPSIVLNSATMGIPSFDKYSGPIRDFWLHIHEMAEYAEENGGLKPDDFSHESMWGQFMERAVTQHGPGVFSVDYLDPDFCDLLVEEFSTWPYKVNEEEPEDAQIPEVVLQGLCKPLYETLRSLYHGAMTPLAKVLFGIDAEFCASIQAAKYTPDNTPHGCWHTDRDSDVTLVVALTDDHEGGGTTVYQGPFADPITVPQLPKGHAMFFLGRTNLHMGLPVTEGTRNLLVHWYKIEGSYSA